MVFARSATHDILANRLPMPPRLPAWDESRVTNADEEVVRSAMTRLAQLARDARAELVRGDHAAFAACVDASFDARREMMDLDERHVAMIERARACGAGANYTGSGGAITAVCRDESHRADAHGLAIDLVRKVIRKNTG